MRVGVFTTVYRDVSLDEAVERLSALGVGAIELGTGNWPGDQHCAPAALLGDAAACAAFRRRIEAHGLTISALSQHGNPVHPDAAVAEHDHATFVDTVRLAGELEVPVVNGFSGCPGDGPEGRRPNWVTCAWPPEFREILEWQ